MWTQTCVSACMVGASFAEDVITRKSVSGYASVKNKAVITYGVKGQTKVALSSGDAELRALSECKREADWLHKGTNGSLGPMCKVSFNILLFNVGYAK